MTRPIGQIIMAMHCCESLLKGSTRIAGTDNHPFIIEKIQDANELLKEADAIPHTDRHWMNEMVLDETYHALEQAIEIARNHVRSGFRQVGA